MGQVFRAYDERLDRWVAIKLIHPERAGRQLAEERFRREARAAAALSHPAIVQIHDILNTSSGDAIVMELVEGETLAERVRRGSLPPAEVAALGAEIAGGLAAAHNRGIVHRDLKPENVLVDRSGRARVLDFGIAKRTVVEEPSLTGDHIVIGTYRSMSPEQALGLEVDARSDLFSLGLLLYEALIGRSPFHALTTYDTLHRICNTQHEPVAEVDPSVPHALSTLIDELLEKDPARRPESAAVVEKRLVAIAHGAAATRTRPSTAATTLESEQRPLLPQPSSSFDSLGLRRRTTWLAAGVFTLALLAAAFTWVLRPRGPLPIHVAVASPEIVSAVSMEVAQDAAAALELSLLRGLLSFAGVSPLPPEQVDPIGGTPVEVAQALAADELLRTRLTCELTTCRISLSRLRGDDGSVRWTGSLSTPVGEPYLLAEALTGHLREAYPERRALEVAVLEVSREDLEEYLRLRQRLHNEGESLDLAIRQAEELRLRSPRFLEATLLEAHLRRVRFLDGREPAELERAFALLRSARELAPRDPRPLHTLFEVALSGERLAESSAALDELERLQPGEPETLVRRAHLLERRGQTDEAMRLMTEAVRLRPSWIHLYRLANMHYRRGASGAARETLHALLERFPGSRDGRSLLAQIELLAGDPAEAARLYEGLLDESASVTVLSNLGFAYMLLKRYEESEEVLRRAAELEPANPYFALNLADALQLLERREQAEETYRRVIALVDADPARPGWQLQSVKAQALAHLGRRKEAIEAAQQMLLSAQDNPQAAGEASLVYTLVGEISSAEVYAEKALKQGIDPGWFSLPWFHPLLEGSEAVRELTGPGTRPALAPPPYPQDEAKRVAPG